MVAPKTLTNAIVAETVLPPQIRAPDLQRRKAHEDYETPRSPFVTKVFSKKTRGTLNRLARRHPRTKQARGPKGRTIVPVGWRHGRDGGRAFAGNCVARRLRRAVCRHVRWRLRCGGRARQTDDARRVVDRRA